MYAGTTVTFGCSSSTATTSLDYALVVDMVTVTPTQVNCFMLQIIDDETLENNETVELILNIPTENAAVINLDPSTQSTRLIIINNDGNSKIVIIIQYGIPYIILRIFQTSL